MSRENFPDVRIESRPSVEGPRGPHLFRSSSSSSEFSFDFALQMSPVLDKRQLLRIDTLMGPESVAMTATPINSAPAAVAPAGQRWDFDEPRTWTAPQVATWMYNSGVEHAVVEKFEFHDITGNVLLDLQFQDLKELGIQSFGKRHEVWSHICALRGGNGQISPQPTPFQDISRPVSTNSRTRSQSVPREMPRDDNSDDCTTPITPGAGKRRRRKHRRNGDEAVTPAESVSIVAIEQLIPKPHKCAKGENCSKFRKQQRLLRRLHEEHGFPISPEAGGRIFIAGDPGNATVAPKLVDNVHRRASEALPVDVGASLVASSDILGPGDLPTVALYEEHLKHVQERDPQENVKSFLTLQQVEPPMPEEPMSPNAIEMFPQLRPPPGNTQATLASLQTLPRLEIPRHPTMMPNHDVFSADYSAYQTAIQDSLPYHPAMSPQSVYRFGTPASEMDVPVTAIPRDPFARGETSQSVPPNMHFRDPVQRASSRVQSRRPSQPLPVLREEFFAPAAQPNRQPQNSAVSHRSSTTTFQDAEYAMSPKAASDGDKTPNAATYHDSVNHHGWMKKRKTRLLRHEWQDHHFRLTGNRLAMHSDDLPESRPLDTLNIDNYAVACSSVASNKLSSKLKALKISQDKNKPGQIATPFSFQLVPAIDGEREMGKLHKAVAGTKTHHFAVHTRDERIDWMRELMLAKALRAKGEGYSVEVNGNIV